MRTSSGWSNEMWKEIARVGLMVGMLMSVWILAAIVMTIAGGV